MRPIPARLRRLAPLAAVGVLAAGCAPPTRVRTMPRTGGVRVESGVQLGWATKPIATKQPPVTLVATDGTVCRVAPERYEHTERGALVACEWQLGEPAPER